ncbi:MAG TPA: acyl-ACP--UDP-N-acetylglucosamine O-acyltransferase [Vicinamibacterales bacterium]|nr:acyl-ACP--UDP-N-acetylglucosamine O-acyltransferase [Vicinamibacterales bacterium]
MPTNIPLLLERLPQRFPSFLVDAIVEHEPGRRLVAVKSVTTGEEFFQGHFPGSPLMPGVLMIEALAQAATVLMFERECASRYTRALLRGVDNAKFRRQVVPGDLLRLEVRVGRERPPLVWVHAAAYVEDQVVAEADLLLALKACAEIDPRAIVHPGAQIGEGTIIGPYAVIGPNVRLGRNCRVGASAVIDGWTEIGDETQIFPFASIGLIPQDLKYRGENTRVVIGRKNVFREFVTIHRGTQGGGGLTSIGDRNLFMAYVHVAHDCRIGNNTIFGNAATLGGHVQVEDYATISAFSGVHQFCRVGEHAFIGGYSVVTKDAMPYAKTVGNRARIYGLNTVGLMRRGFNEETLSKLKRAYRYLLVSKLTTSRALRQIEEDDSLQCPEVQSLVEFIRSSQRGVILRRPTRRAEEMVADD